MMHWSRIWYRPFWLPDRPKKLQRGPLISKKSNCSEAQKVLENIVVWAPHGRMGRPSRRSINPFMLILGDPGRYQKIMNFRPILKSIKNRKVRPQRLPRGQFWTQNDGFWSRFFVTFSVLFEMFRKRWKKTLMLQILWFPIVLVLRTLENHEKSLETHLKNPLNAL